VQRPEFDAELASRALNSMVTPCIYFWLVMSQDLDEEGSVVATSYASR
jgi:hypothetical protein